MLYGQNDMKTMTLAQIAGNLDHLDPAYTIYAEATPEWVATSPAVICRAPEDGTLPTEAKGMLYFLEVSVAQEVIEVWKKWRGGRVPSSGEKCTAIIYYAINDSYLPP